MRPPRIIIAVVFFVTAVFLTILSFRSEHAPPIIDGTSAAAPKTGISALFSFRAPFSLFPPNAIITLTHENSTAFLARPAAFGPPLPIEGLKGRVWIGSGFGDDGIRQGPAVTGAEGELGCSDVRGGESYNSLNSPALDGVKLGDGKSAASSSSKVQGRGSEATKSADERKSAGDSAHRDGLGGPPVNDGTDDYLHHPLPGSTVSKETNAQPTDSKANHADIQSIQEGAEIAGKVVLLSRGGCGFLEKVKWAQRRGAIALIVGDDVKGGPLIQMYARGDTSNVTIPSIFTSRTTAHLLSSLIGPDSFLEDTLDENGKPLLTVHHTDKIKKTGKKHHSRPTFTPTAGSIGKPTSISRTPTKAASKKGTAAKAEEKLGTVKTERSGWLRSLFFSTGKGNSQSDSSRPPSSGQLDWVLVDDWKDDGSVESKKIQAKPKKKTETDKNASKKKAGSKQPSGDDFVIGVQDWRDPDLVGTSDAETAGKAPNTKGAKPEGVKSDSTQQIKPGGKKHIGGALQEIPEYVPSLRGGSITPGSGEYGTGGPSVDQDVSTPEESKTKSKGLLNAIFGDDEEDVEFLTPHIPGPDDEDDEDSDDEGYEGLWVTLTPTSGASPFLDTLLVLVVSPLVTLCVVYALLLIRSRIRRRRWRAPKSVVERLPVRTYQTIVPTTPSPSSSRIPTTTESSITTPLLQSPPTRPRPRSRTTTGIPEPGDLARANSNPLQVSSIPPRSPEHENHQGSHTSEWRKYMGKQIECVVCLEEYVDGVSRVMSLPCGHEFHVDCITPWLTTRRRTCPICKGDVVRSLARGSPSSPRYDAYHDDSDDDSQDGLSRASSSLPIPTGSDDDLERGLSSSPTRHGRGPRSGSWRGILANSLGSSSRSPRPTPPQEDRNR
ncbi:hypothetical protein HYFRA_00005664 [Hymenoscyphus fraxineus]|uniref:RING-type domain-containing protein n=1 Tax=Hymenoscyphus fraxineus TaxID=746836 RepID=A0A9N9PQA3_9HELO|nr:hypothetical protein HYFRA_00005664 [Hymenoscyphus fraxineus]